MSEKPTRRPFPIELAIVCAAISILALSVWGIVAARLPKLTLPAASVDEFGAATLNVNRINLADQDGNVRLMIGIENNLTFIQFLGESRQLRLLLSQMSGLGPTILFCDDSGRKRLVLNAGDQIDGVPSVIAFDRLGNDIYHAAFRTPATEAPPHPSAKSADHSPGEIARFTGSAAQTTPSFDAPAVWRIRWSGCTEPAMIMVFDAATGQLTENAATGQESSGTSVVHGAGTYYLKIIRAGECTIVVESDD